MYDLQHRSDEKLIILRKKLIRNAKKEHCPATGYYLNNHPYICPGIHNHWNSETEE
jgi:hypothetical protein